MLLCLIYGTQASSRQAPGKPEGSQKHGFVSTSHSPWVSLRAEQDAHEVGQSPCTQGKFFWVPLWWLSIAPGRILRSSGQSLHLPTWGLQAVSSRNNTKGTTSWITNGLFSWLHLEISRKHEVGKDFVSFALSPSSNACSVWSPRTGRQADSPLSWLAPKIRLIPLHPSTTSQMNGGQVYSATHSSFCINTCMTHIYPVRMTHTRDFPLVWLLLDTGLR